MKNVSAFLKRHSALLLLVLVLATVPAGIAFGKYVKSVNVTSGISITVSVATPANNYTIDKGMLKNVLQDLQTPATALYFVTGSKVPVNARQVGEDIKARGSGSIYAYQEGTDIYIAPADRVDAPLHAPADSSYFLSVNYNGGYLSVKESKIRLLTYIKCDNLDTSGVTDMSYMFCMVNDYGSETALATLDVSNFNTANVTNMSHMFCGCSSLTSLNVNNFTTSNVKNMDSMFYGCKSLSSLDLSNFITSNVTNMSSMFQECSGLTSLNVSSFGTSSVTSMSYMFNACRSLTSLDVSNFTTSNVTNMRYMFYECKSLSSLDLSNFITSKVTNMRSMFDYCRALTSLNVSSFDTRNVEDMSYMFENCTALTTINASDKFNTGNVTSSNGMFTNCSKLKGGNGTPYNSKITDKTYARIDGGTKNPGYFTDINAKSTLTVTGSNNAKGISFD